MHYMIYNTMIPVGWLLSLIGAIMFIYQLFTKDTREEKDKPKTKSLTVPSIICFTIGFCLTVGGGIVSSMIDDDED